MEHGYFSGSSKGDSEQEVDGALNEKYELPFNKLLPLIDSGLDLFLSEEVKDVCAQYVSNLFQRCKARRKGADALVEELNKQHREIATDAEAAKAYAAKLSCLARHAISVSELQETLLRQIEEQTTPAAKSTRFVDDLVRSTEVLATELTSLHWSIVYAAPGIQLFISDTPVISIGANSRSGLQFGVGVRNATAQWFLPVSPRKAIRITHQRSSSDELSVSGTGELNRAQVLTMSSRMYGASKDPWLDGLVQSYGGVYEFHRDVFKGSPVNEFQDEFDKSIANLLNIVIPRRTQSPAPK